MKIKTLTVTVLVLVLVTLASYGQTKEIYINPKFADLAKDHKTIAILPFNATINLRPKQRQSMSDEQFDKLQKDEGLAVQSALLSYFLKRKEQHDFAVGFMDINTINATLAKNDINHENIGKYTPAELCELLGVDAIITGTLRSDKPMSDGASVALGLLVGFYGTTNSGNCTININDGKTGELLWKYDKTLARSLGSDTNTIINAMMRKASRKLPYIN